MAVEYLDMIMNYKDIGMAFNYLIKCYGYVDKGCLQSIRYDEKKLCSKLFRLNSWILSTLYWVLSLLAFSAITLLPTYLYKDINLNGVYGFGLVLLIGVFLFSLLFYFAIKILDIIDISEKIKWLMDENNKKLEVEDDN